jgi:hypothetical protein
LARGFEVAALEFEGYCERTYNGVSQYFGGVHMFSKILTVSLVASWSLSAMAAHDWKKCEAEIKKFGCKGNDEAIYQCLLKHDDELKKSKCDEAHSAYEEATKKK